MGIFDWFKNKEREQQNRSNFERSKAQYMEIRLAEKKAWANFVYGKYDAAQSTPENIQYWASSDSLSADAANSLDVRTKLRNRARYEVANNSYAKSMVQTIANYVIGNGPKLQVLTDDSRLNEEVEKRWAEYAWQVKCAQKLRTITKARMQDGEGVLRFMTNPKLSGVQVEPRPLETDRISTPGAIQEGHVDGIELDELGNPERYHVLKRHPGGEVLFSHDSDAKDAVSADQLVLWFRHDRPEQHRGVPEITPALPLFAQLRRYTLAVIRAAETAADVAAVLETNSPPGGEAEYLERLDQFPLDRGTFMSLPAGWQLGQVEAEQPTTGYAEFKREILAEACASMLMPYNVGAMDSADYNYASGRLDHQGFFRAIDVLQGDCAREVMDPWLRQWYSEAKAEYGIDGPDEMPPYRLFWRKREHVDPDKESKSQERRLKNKTTTYAEEYAADGKDWEEEFEQRAREERKAEELGIRLADTEGQPGEPAPEPGDEKGDEEGDN